MSTPWKARSDAYQHIHETNEFRDGVDRVAKEIVATIKKGNIVYIIGNGGSAAEAQHFAAEIVGRYKTERRGYAAFALTTDTSALTAIGNDYGFDSVFTRQVEALGREGDLLFAISTSGNSKNILSAVEAARKLGMYTVGLTGKDGGALAKCVHDPLVVPSQDTAIIQEVHLTAIHLICEAFDAAMSEGSKSFASLRATQLDRIAAWRKNGKRIAAVSGSFDVFHSGHVDFLTEARAQGDHLVVFLNSDASVRSYKGPHRPIVPQDARAQLVRALSCVDEVIVFDEPTPLSLIDAVKPDIYVNGSERGEYCLERPFVEAYGGKVHIVSKRVNTSSSGLITRIVDGQTTTTHRAVFIDVSLLRGSVFQDVAHALAKLGEKFSICITGVGSLENEQVVSELKLRLRESGVTPHSLLASSDRYVQELIDHAQVHEVSLDKSWCIGASEFFIQSGRLTNMSTILVAPSDLRGMYHPDYRVADMREALGTIASIS